MAFMEKKHEICSPFLPRRNALRKTSAEIVSEARLFLRVQSTLRPFTPRDGQRQLFGRNSARAEQDNRPPSTFSLHAQNFDASDSRPSSGTRLAPLHHKPKFPDECNVVAPSKIFPKPPTDPAEARKGLVRSQIPRLKAGSLTTLPPLEGHTHVKERLNAVLGQKQQSAKRASSADHTTVPRKPGPRRSASESISSREVQPGVDSGPTECRAERKTELVYGDNTVSTEESAESLLWNDVIAPLLHQLESVAAGSSEASLDLLCDLCDCLHGTLAEADMLGRRCKRRSGILRTLFRLVDLNSAQLSLLIAKLCLALRVSGNNLLNICKLVFQISRSESNDVLFQNNSIIDLLLDVLCNEDVSASGEALLYCVGTLKFFSGNIAMLRLLLDKNCISAAQKLLKKLCMVEDTNFIIAGHILVQLTATLRNLADHSESRPLFVSFSILPELCLVLRKHCNDQDVCTNISRIYSKLSSYSECRSALAQTPDCYQLFLELLSKHHQKQDLVVRILFTLGNITAKIDESRQQLFQCNGCMDTLLGLYNSYQRKDVSSCTPLQKCVPSPCSAQEADDVLVKLVRVLANMCIHPAVGPSLANNTTCLQLLMETLELRSVQESEELMINVATTINNLSFYQEEDSPIRCNELTIAKLMLKLVISSSMDAMFEAMCVYGNLSQSRDVREFIMQNKVHRFLVMLLDFKSAEMCFSACGVLVNLALDPPNRACLALQGASAKLVDCLRYLGAGDWQLAGLVCQAVWNLTGGGSEAPLDARERESLLETLTTYSDEEEALKWTENEDARDFHRACWESQFLPVAQKLMAGLQSVDLTA